MNIVIINDYAGVAKYGMTLRHFYLAKEFVKSGHNVTIVSASYSHLFKNYPNLNGKAYKIEEFSGVNFVWVGVCKYDKAFSVKRVLKWFQFIIKCFFIKKYIPNKVDVVISSPTAPFGFIPAYFMAKYKNAKLIFEVRDIWPKTLTSVGKFKNTHPLIKLMAYFERFAINKCNILVSNLSNYGQHVTELGIKKDFNWISNGIDLDEMKAQYSIPNHVRGKIPKNKFIIGYAGKIGVSNGVEGLLKAAYELRNNLDLAFVIVGDGELLDSYQKSVSELNNVYFLGAIPKETVQDVLSYFSVCYIGYLDKDLYRYGVAPNKIFDYMYSGKPIIEAINAPMSLIDASDCGISIDSDNLNQLVEAIIKLKETPSAKRDLMGLRGHNYVVANFSYSKLANDYIQLIGN